MNYLYILYIFSTTGYVCTEITRLHDTVMELKFGNMSLTKEYACDKEYFNESTPSFTLVGMNDITIHY